MRGLVLRIENLEPNASGVELGYSSLDLGDLAAGEHVGVGYSVVPGIWQIVAVGRLVKVVASDSMVHVAIDALFHLHPTLAVVTDSSRNADEALAPLDMGWLSPEDIKRVSSAIVPFGKQNASNRTLATEGEEEIKGGQAFGALELERQDESFFYRVARAYDWRCCFMGYGQSSRDGKRKAGAVIAIEAPHWSRGAVSEGLFVSSSIAFSFREGYVAIGDDYEILRSPLLDARLRTMLDVLNPKALISLPETYEDWPDMAALTRHRKRFGY